MITTVMVVVIVMMIDFGMLGPKSRFFRAVASGKYTSRLNRLL